MIKVSSRVQRAFVAAAKCRKNAHAPYSRYRVGAALLLDRGPALAGCNVENASFGATICAERNCLLQAVARHGRRGARFEAIVVVTGETPPAPPCALCLQVMSEFCGPDFAIYLANPRGIQSCVPLRELLPRPFNKFVGEGR